MLLFPQESRADWLGRPVIRGAMPFGWAPRLVWLSRALSRVLRHTGRREGLHIFQDGYARLADVMRIRCVAALLRSEQDIRDLVRLSNKRRFQILDGEGMGGP